jgi:hypothetical protein
MKERPILFSGPMVRSLLDGSKTQTRRIVKPQPGEDWRPDSMADIHKMVDGEFPMRNGEPIVIGWGAVNEDGDKGYICPYGQPGDRLWVRESVTVHHPTEAYYNADSVRVAQNGERFPWKDSAQRRFSSRLTRSIPSIHMPRWASRLLLEIVSVRVERLQDITEADAKTEGVVAGGRAPGHAPHIYENDESGRDLDPCNHGDEMFLWREGYRTLWESINGPGSWDANPWVWVVEFKRVSP